MTKFKTWHYDWSARINGHVTSWHVGPYIAPPDEMGAVHDMISIENDTDDAEGVARLMAAGPDLLSSLEKMLDLFAPLHTVDGSVDGETSPTAGGDAIWEARMAVYKARNAKPSTDLS